MEVEHCNIFVGGVSQETCEETLENHFKKYGEIKKCEVIRYKSTGPSRGFGFITFAHPTSLNKALRDERIICGRSQVPPQERRTNGSGLGGVTVVWLNVEQSVFIIWSKRIRTFACRYQKPMPYHLAILHMDGRNGEPLNLEAGRFFAFSSLWTGAEATRGTSLAQYSFKTSTRSGTDNSHLFFFSI